MKKILSILIILSSLFGDIRIPGYSTYVDKSYESAAEVYLKAIYHQVGFYYAKVGDVPSALDDMRNENVLDLEQKAEIDWDFDLSGIQLLEDQGSSSNFTGTLVATSTAEMSGGEGQVVQYDIETATFCGYGHDECE